VFLAVKKRKQLNVSAYSVPSGKLSPPVSGAHDTGTYFRPTCVCCVGCVKNTQWLRVALRCMETAVDRENGPFQAYLEQTFFYIYQTHYYIIARCTLIAQMAGPILYASGGLCLNYLLTTIYKLTEFSDLPKLCFLE